MLMKASSFLWCAAAIYNFTVVRAQSVIAYQSFEHEKAIAGNYIDPETGGEDYNPTNLPGQPIIDSTRTSASAGSLAFDLTYLASRTDIQDPGFSNGADIGVKSDETEDPFTNGSQGYKFSNPDGTMVLTFAPVDLNNLVDVAVSIDSFLAETTWELSDFTRIDVVTDEGTETILNTDGQSIDDLSIEGVWITRTARLPDTATTASLIVSFESGSPPETMYIDNIIFEADSAGGGNDGGDDGSGQACNDGCSGLFLLFCWFSCFVNGLWNGVSSVSTTLGVDSGSFTLPLVGLGDVAVGVAAIAALGVSLLILVAGIFGFSEE